MKKILNLNFEVVLLKTIQHELNRFLHGATQFSPTTATKMKLIGPQATFVPI